jgi:hypothetical protein
MRYLAGATVGQQVVRTFHFCRWGRRCAQALTLWALMAAPTRADLILDFTDQLPTAFAVPTTFGWSFSVSSSLNVAALGIWDEGGDGLALSHQVGLWTNAGALLAQATVDNTSIPVASASPAGRWLFTNVAPFNLSAGTYVLGAYYPNLLDTFRQDTGLGITTIPGVTHLNRRNAFPIDGFAFPDQVFVAGGYFGPNLSTTPVGVTAVPEPSSLALLALGIIGLAYNGGRRLGRRAGHEATVEQPEISLPRSCNEELEQMANEKR